MPLLGVHTVTDRDLNVLDFIEESYQPLLVLGAIKKSTISSLMPWTFPALQHSIEAATTFCLASPGGVAAGELDGCTVGQCEGKEMSLRRFGVEGKDKWSYAITNFTKDIGLAVKVPRFLNVADFTLLDPARSGLHHVRQGWHGTSESVVAEEGDVNASVICVVEGGISVTLTPFLLPWTQLKCDEEVWQCELMRQGISDWEDNEEKVMPDENSDHHLFLARTTVLPQACLYIPPAWQWSANIPKDTTLLWLRWRGDLAITHQAMEALSHLLQDDTHLGEESIIKVFESWQKRGPSSLWEVVPKEWSRPLVLWGGQNPLLHLVRRYLLSDRSLNLHQFLEEFRVDRTLLPDLVDCPKECQSSAHTIFILLDTDSDGLLTDVDATMITRSTFTLLTQELDELVDELVELGQEQWQQIIQDASPSSRASFLERAKDRMVLSAKTSVKRWVDGDLEGADEDTLKEHLPSLHAKVIEARENKSREVKTEL
ncbi:hypothetical protein Pmani_003291 [Petrolisthes manimaculis]|uniref:Uncharacterized protein n=1 Tax=Petrolisthes manimaculis TaxID=1843537 RepID=A0AAE1QIV2_9EUCA|nr:hypothetical protein Pmani_003291 [Petrolisthes manimaculis]